MLPAKILTELYDLLKVKPSHKDWVRFFQYVDARRWNDCWMWTASQTSTGYGQFNYRNDIKAAHRHMMLWLHGPLGRWDICDHVVCDQPLCVNPLHLRVTTQRENLLRSKRGMTAINARKTHCPKNHPLEGDNLDSYHLREHGQRKCRTCHNDQQRGAKKRRRELALQS